MVPPIKIGHGISAVEGKEICEPDGERHATECLSCVDAVSAKVRKVDKLGNSSPNKIVCNPNLSVVTVVRARAAEAEETAETG